MIFSMVFLVYLYLAYNHSHLLFLHGFCAKVPFYVCSAYRIFNGMEQW